MNEFIYFECRVSQWILCWSKVFFNMSQLKMYTTSLIYFSLFSTVKISVSLSLLLVLRIVQAGHLHKQIKRIKMLTHSSIYLFMLKFVEAKNEKYNKCLHVCKIIYSIDWILETILVCVNRSLPAHIEQQRIIISISSVVAAFNSFLFFSSILFFNFSSSFSLSSSSTEHSLLLKSDFTYYCRCHSTGWPYWIKQQQYPC